MEWPYSGSRRETSFAVGLKGVAAEDVEKVETIVEETLRAIAQDGFPRDRVDAIMHQVELSAARTSTQFGLGVAFGAMGTWVHGGDGMRPLRTPAMAAMLNAALDADPKFWQKLVRGGSWKTRTRSPSSASRRRVRREARGGREEAVNAIQEALDDEKKKIVNEAVALSDTQDATQDATVLPTLIVADAVPRDINKWGAVKTATGKPLQIDPQPTNGITYANVLLDVTNLPDRLAPYLDLFADYITELGTKKRDYKQLAQREAQNRRRRRRRRRQHPLDGDGPTQMSYPSPATRSIATSTRCSISSRRWSPARGGAARRSRWVLYTGSHTTAFGVVNADP